MVVRLDVGVIIVDKEVGSELKDEFWIVGMADAKGNPIIGQTIS